jgi:hypothetical protein
MISDGLELIEGSVIKNLVITNVTQTQKAALQHVDVGEIVYQTDGTTGVYINGAAGWHQLDATAAPYTLAAATTAVLGGVKVGTGLTVDVGGTLSTMPATTTTLGGVKVGTGLAIDTDGLLTATATGSTYTLTAATATALGGVKVGTGLAIDTDGLLTATATGGTYTLTAATATALGGVKVGAGLAIDTDGLLTATATGGTYTLTAATATALGGIKVGAGLAIDTDGLLTATGGGSYTLTTATATTLGGVKVGTGLAIDTNGLLTATGGGSYTLPVATPTVLGGVKVSGNDGVTLENGVLKADVKSVDPVFTGNASFFTTSIILQGDVTATTQATYDETKSDLLATTGFVHNAIASTVAATSWTAINSNYTATAGSKLLINTTAANITITLPSTRVEGATTVSLVDANGTFGTHALTVLASAGDLIEGAISKVYNTSTNVTLLYYNATRGWIQIN